MCLRTAQREILLPLFWADLWSPLSNNSCPSRNVIKNKKQKRLYCEILLNEIDYFNLFHNCEPFCDTTNNMTWCKLQRVNVARVSLSGRLAIQHQSVSGIPVAVLCAEAALYTDKSLIKVHNSLTPTHPPTAECKPSDILSQSALQVWLQG